MSLSIEVAVSKGQSHHDFSCSLLSKAQQSQLRGLLEKGLPTTSQPYQHLAEQISNVNNPVNENMVIEQISLWQEQGLIRRFGLVVKHRKLGFNANAMVVWNIPDEQVDMVAKALSQCQEVSLCYRRPRRLPDWPYNLFCMIHGTEREVVLQQIDGITNGLSLSHIEKNVLFSTRAFKQQGARYGKQHNIVQRGSNE
ncbi:Lrp/AsnC family transcriptional regulator [Thalassotalea sp. G2M2-11]|uniref:siroheme decarboxylase subunit beta n=1 Tax=Thalassotalea sp. G2M2-11 TaxID=2787627 RepID=UPI0019CFE79A|nr:Lrp/AsnC family transcriptional regulator [Thalassotalea sp. G2M2-11]